MCAVLCSAVLCGDFSSAFACVRAASLPGGGTADDEPPLLDGKDKSLLFTGTG